MDLKLNTIAGTLALLYAFGMSTYLLIFHSSELSPLQLIFSVVLILLAQGIFFGCYNKENPQNAKKH